MWYTRLDEVINTNDFFKNFKKMIDNDIDIDQTCKITDDSIEYYFEVPGFTKEDLELTYIEGHIYIKGKKTIGSKEKQVNTSLYVPTEIDLESLSAEVKDGILKIITKRKKKENPLKIKCN